MKHYILMLAAFIFHLNVHAQLRAVISESKTRTNSIVTNTNASIEKSAKTTQLELINAIDLQDALYKIYLSDASNVIDFSATINSLDSLYQLPDQKDSYKNLYLNNSLLLKEFLKEKNTIPDSSVKAVVARIKVLGNTSHNKASDNNLLHYTSLWALKNEIEKDIPFEKKSEVQKEFSNKRPTCICSIFFVQDFSQNNYRDFRLYIVDQPLYDQIRRKVQTNDVYIPSNALGLNPESTSREIETMINQYKNRFPPAVAKMNIGDLAFVNPTMSVSIGQNPYASYVNCLDMYDATWYAVLVIKNRVCFLNELHKCQDEKIVRCTRVSANNILP